MPKKADIDPQFAGKQIAFDLPSSMSARLNALVALAHSGAERTSRKELVAALIAAAEPDVVDVADLLGRYRRATVSDARVADHGLQQYVDPSPTPGRFRLALGAFESEAEDPDAGAAPIRTQAKKRVGADVAAPVDAQLTELVAAARSDYGLTTSRTEVVGALILGAPETVAGLEELLADYRAFRRRARGQDEPSIMATTTKKSARNPRARTARRARIR